MSVLRGRPPGFAAGIQRLQTLPLRITQIAGKGRSRLLVGRPMRLRPHPESKPPSHLGGGESRAANPRYKLLGQALTLKTNRISWNFEDQQHPPFFLAFEKTNLSPDTFFFGFQAHGKNNSDKPISHISGFVRSYITNKEFPIKLLVQGRPVDPDKTNGIPPFAEFEVVTLGSIISVMNGVIQTKPEDIGEFAEFSFEFDYDGNKFVRVFTKQEIQKQREMWADISDPTKSSIPRVTLKE